MRLPKQKCPCVEGKHSGKTFGVAVQRPYAGFRMRTFRVCENHFEAYRGTGTFLVFTKYDWKHFDIDSFRIQEGL